MEVNFDLQFYGHWQNVQKIGAVINLYTYIDNTPYIYLMLHKYTVSVWCMLYKRCLMAFICYGLCCIVYVANKFSSWVVSSHSHHRRQGQIGAKVYRNLHNDSKANGVKNTTKKKKKIVCLTFLIHIFVWIKVMQFVCTCFDAFKLI